jgi:HSP20 family molecular chaperone IbpA
MSFSRSRSLFREVSPLFRLLEHQVNVAHPLRLRAQFVPAAACSTAHMGRRSHPWNHEGVTPWINRFRWGWGWDPVHWNAGGHPTIDMVEKADAYVIEADLPGVKKADVSVRVGDEGWSLIVEGRRNTAASSVDKVEGQGERDHWLYTPMGLMFICVDAEEIKPETDALLSKRADTFLRKIWFSQMVDKRSVTAKLEDGVLKVRVPKKMDGDGDGSVGIEIA